MTDKTKKNNAAKPADKASKETAKPADKASDKASAPKATIDKKPSSKNKAADKPKKQKSISFFNILTFLIALFTLVMTFLFAYEGYKFYQKYKNFKKETQSLRQSMSKLEIELSQLRLLDQQPIIQKLMNEANEQKQYQANIQETINKRFEDFALSNNETRTLSERTRNDWFLHEISYLLRMASTRLYLAKDIDSSIAALTQADLRISELRNPIYLPVRKTLSEEITALQALSKPDIDGTILKIVAILNKLSTLPKAKVEEEGEKSTVAITSAKAEDWLSKLFKLIGLKRNSTEVVIPKADDDILFLEQQARVYLREAKEALISRNGEDFSKLISQTQALINEHYLADDESVVSVSEQLQKISEANLFPELPDITKSLNLLQSILNQYKRVDSDNEAVKN